MQNAVAQYVKALHAEASADDQFADKLAAMAGELRGGGLEQLADDLQRTGRQFRIKALDLRGRAAAADLLRDYGHDLPGQDG